MPEEKRLREAQELDDYSKPNSLLDTFKNSFNLSGLSDKRVKEVNQVWDGGSDSFPNHNSDFFWRDETPSARDIAFFTAKDF